MTIGDLACWGAAHLDGESGTGPSLLPRSTWERLHAPFRDNYASGWLRYQSGRLGGPVTLHNGSNTLWYALLVLVPRGGCAGA